MKKILLQLQTLSIKCAVFGVAQMLAMLIVLLALLQTVSNSRAAQSAWVHFDNAHMLVYSNDVSGNKVMDFSSAGYMGGGVAIPNVVTVQTLNPSGGDDTAAMQGAINYVGGLAADTNGIRGALQLGTGAFLVSGQINITASGVVVRGSGSGAGGTIIKVTASSPITLFNIVGSGSPSTSGKVSITNSYVPSGAMMFGVSNASGFAVGDTVIIGRTVTTNWIHYLGMDALVHNGATQTWISAGTVITTDRTIKQISGNQITLDAPLTDSFDTSYLGIPAGTMSKYSWTGRISQVGLENFFIQEPAVTTTYASVYMGSLIDSWVRDVVIQDGARCFKTDSSTKRITVDGVIIQHTVATNAAAPAADFDCYGTQLFFNNCKAFGTTGNRMWPFLTQATSTGPIVLLNFYTTEILGITPHQRWTTGVLADNCSLPNTTDGEDRFLGEQGINYCNRGTAGTGQGWATGWSVAWNVISPYFLVSAAPGTKNWCIGGIGTKISDSPNPDGIYDAFGSIVSPQSLYFEQLKERLGGAAIENIGYQLFTISNSPSSRTIPAGANTTFSVNVGDPTLMSNIVALSVSGLPAGASASFNTNSVTSAGNATLTVTASNSIAPGVYTFNVIGASVGLSHTNAISLVIGSFSLSASPASQTVLAGSNTSYTVALATNSSFTGSVNFGVGGLPPGAGASFNPAALNTNGNSTLSLTTASNTPPGNYPLTINGTNGGGISSATVALTINTLVVNSDTLLWTNGAADMNWSSALNWTNITSGGYGPPGIFNDVVFTNFSAAVTGSTINNMVSSDTAVNSLAYENISGFHTTQIALGKTLSVGGSGGLVVGTETDLGNAASVYSTITGAGSALVISNANANLIVRQASASSGGALKATLNLSGLDNFQATIARIELGALGGSARPCGILYLAKTNFITASGASPAIILGGQGGVSGGNSGNGSFLYLGQTNAIFANSISMATFKQGGCLMLFNPAFTGNSPSAYFRATDGVGPVSSWLIADSGSSGGTVNTSGTNDFSGGTVDALVNNLTIARSTTGSGNGNSSGTLTFAAGTMNIGTLQIGVQGSSSANVATATVNVNGAAQLLVATNLELAHVVGGTGAAGTVGTLNVNGGIVQTTNIFGGGGVSTINLNSGTMDLQAGNPFPGSIANVSSLRVGANGVAGNALLKNAASIVVSNTITIATNGMITGNTFITSPGLIVNGTIAPGTPTTTGLLTCLGNVTINGTNMMKLNKNNATNDVLSVGGNLVYGGTLNISVLSGMLAINDSFKLFNATGYSSSFANVVPATPGAGLAWDMSSLAVNGILSVVSSGVGAPHREHQRKWKHAGH